MPITINGSGTVTGITAGGLPDGVITTDDIAANAVTYAKIGTTEQGQLCKAWVNFDGAGTVAIRASYNVSSITDNGTGDYTVNFTTALADANYSVCGAYRVANSLPSRGTTSVGIGATMTSSAVNVQTAYGSTTSSNGSTEDPSIVCVAIFR